VADSSKAHELRREPRLTPSRKVKVYGASDEPEVAKILDCSRHGVALIMSRPLHVDSQFLLRVKSRGRQLVAYTVRGCVRMREGEYRIGAELVGLVHESVETDADGILQNLLEPEAER
jgi:hypothetical protein